MSSAGIGRLLTASLHQAITELLPARLPFYEPWLATDGFRTTRVSLAGIRAALSFLRQEETGYDVVLRRAGELAATWVWQDFSAVRRAWLRSLPAWVRRRVAASLLAALASDSWRETRASARWRRGEGTLTIKASLFCEVRSAVPGPLCQYYAAGLSQFLKQLAVDGEARIAACRAVDGTECVLRVPSPSRVPVAEVVGLTALVLMLSGAVPAAAPQPAPRSPAVRDRVLVLPFENVGRDPRWAWLGEGTALIVTDHLRAAGIDALTRDERRRVFEQLQVPPLVTLSRATVIRVGHLVGASTVVVGHLEREGETFAVRARRIDLESGVLEPEVVERAEAPQLVAALTRLARRMTPGGNASPADEGRLVPRVPSPPAFEQYVKGLIAEAPGAQQTFLQAALRLDPTYDAARLALWASLTAAGDHGAAAEAVRSVPEDSALGVDARFLLSRSYLALGRTAGSAAVLKALQERQPSPVFLNNLGVALLRDQALMAQYGHPAWYFGQARTMDSMDPDYVFNLGYAYWIDGDPEGAAYWLQECVRLDPADAAAHALLARALFAARRPAEAGSELSLATRLSSEFDGLVLTAGQGAPRGAERIKDVLDPWQARRTDAALEMVGQRDQADLAAFYLEHGRRLFERELDRDAEAELVRALYLAPYHAEANLLLARVYLRTGRVRRAIDAAKISLWSAETAAAHAVLAEAYLEARDHDSARLETERALVLDPQSSHARQLLARLSR